MPHRSLCATNSGSQANPSLGMPVSETRVAVNIVESFSQVWAKCSIQLQELRKSSRKRETSMLDSGGPALRYLVF